MLPIEWDRRAGPASRSPVGQAAVTGAFAALAGKLAAGSPTVRWRPQRRPPGPARAAVLLLLAETDRPDLLFTERSARLRKHAGQISFPGGGLEPGDADATAACKIPVRLVSK